MDSWARRELDDIDRKLRGLIEVIAEGLRALKILRGLVERVVLHPGEKGFELIGEITAIVNLGAHEEAAGPKGAAVPEAYGCSVEVVAGVGFEPTTFRL